MIILTLNLVANPQCIDYTAIHDNTRSLKAESEISTVLSESTKNNTIQCPNDESFLANRWVRFYSNDTSRSNVTMQLAEGCSRDDETNVVSQTAFCGAFYRGWIRDRHPTESEGIFGISVI